MASPNVTTSHAMLQCPACKKGIMAEVVFALALTTDFIKEDGTVDAKGTVTGVRISHACVPKVTR